MNATQNAFSLLGRLTSNMQLHFLSSQSFIQQRFMSKYLSKAATKRLPLTTKRARKGYYKGKGGTKEGKITSKGKFIVDPKKRLQLIVPDLEGFKLKPYIASTASKLPPEIKANPGEPASLKDA